MLMIYATACFFAKKRAVLIMFSLISNTAINQQQQQLGIGDAVHDQTRSFISCRLQIEMLAKQNHSGRIA